MTTQMWLLLMCYGAGGLLVMLGYCLMLHQNHNILADPMWLPIFVSCHISYKGFAWFCGKAFRFVVGEKGKVSDKTYKI